MNHQHALHPTPLGDIAESNAIAKLWKYAYDKLGITLQNHDWAHFRCCRSNRNNSNDKNYHIRYCSITINHFTDDEKLIVD